MEKVIVDNQTSYKALFQKAFGGIHVSRLHNRSWQTKASILLVLASVLSGFATYAALAEMPPFGDDPNLVIWLLNIDLIILLLLSSLIARRIVGVWSGRKRGLAGSHLHVRLVYIFSLLVAIPTIIMTVFSAFFFHFGIQAWFSQKVQTAINESQAVAQSYLEEHKQVIRADTLAMANDLDRQADLLALSEQKLSKAINTQSFFRNLSEAIIINRKGQVLGRSSLTFSLEYEKPTNFHLDSADLGDVVLMTSTEQDRVRALVKLQNFTDAYLFVGRMVDPEVISHLNSARIAVEDYNSLQAQYSGMQITSTMIFVTVGVLLLLAAIWAGLLLARQLVKPIGELIQASDRVRAGDLSSRVAEHEMLEEFSYLARSFNRMTEQLKTQRMELIDANRQIDRRRRLTETVLAGVSSGVIGVDHDGLINLANNSASKLLSLSNEVMIDKYLLDVLPELKTLLDKFSANTKKDVQGEITLNQKEKGKRLFLFKISVEILSDNKSGLIITFDDITEVHAAQRNAAWSDVARRIAHEIKNPLTPIQLSAERLKRKYLNTIEDEKDKNSFAQCTDTIIKHVEDIGRMVSEFSSFARMPQPIFKQEDISKPVKDSLILCQQAHGDIAFNLGILTENRVTKIDTQQIRQVITNLLQNAIDSIHEHQAAEKGNISILIDQNNENELFIAITDNGIGFLKDQDINALTEPYVTHKEKGTGLGLAIVRKIIEDHGGELKLVAPSWLKEHNEWQDLHGACVVLTLPIEQKT